MIDPVSDVTPLVIGAALLIVYIFIWDAVRSLSSWPRFLLRAGAAVLLAAVPVAFFVLTYLGNPSSEETKASPPPADETEMAVKKRPKRAYKPLESPESTSGEQAPESAPLDDVPESVPPPPSPMTEVAPTAGPPVQDSADYTVVPVFYGTDRKPDSTEVRIKYGYERGQKLHLGLAQVTVPKIHEVPNVERPWVLTIPFTDFEWQLVTEDPKNHFTMKTITALTREEFLTKVREQLARSRAFGNHALIFIHGYNTSFDNAVYRTAQIAYDLDFDGAAFVYSWPSRGRTESYGNDLPRAKQAEPYLEDFLNLVIKETGAKTVSVIAHSMGHIPLLPVLERLRKATPDGVAISQVIFAAPDEDRDSFRNTALRFKGLAKGMTLYASGNDLALSASRRVWGNVRAGDVPPEGPLVIPGVDTIDVTALGTGVFALNHSSYAEKTELIKDIQLLIKNGKHPPRFPAFLPATTSDGGTYWKYQRP